MAKPKLKPGDVIWAKVPDRNRVVKPDPRPVLIVMVHPVVRDAPVRGLAVSTRADIDPDNDPLVEMPWDAKTGSCTGLFEWCAAVLLWAVNVEQADVVKVSGRVPDDFLAMVGEKLREARFWQMQRKGQ